MVGVEPKANQKVLNLKDLGGFYMDPDILEWVLAVEHVYLSHPGISPLQIAVLPEREPHLAAKYRRQA